jgi:hypothetical protein
MEKLSLGMALVSLFYFAIFLGVTHFNGLLQEWKCSGKRFVLRFLKILSKRQSEDDDFPQAA